MRIAAWRVRSGLVLGGLAVGGLGWTMGVGGCTPAPPDYHTGDDDDSTTSGPSADETVIFSEVMANPARVNDADGEWFELYNTGISAVDLDGWTVTDADGTSITIDGVTIAARDYVVLGNNDQTEGNGGVSLDYMYSGLTLGNQSESLTLRDENGALVDTITWSAAPEGASLSLDPSKYSATDNDDSSNFCASRFSRMADGDYGTPRATNDVCFVNASAGDLVITEIMANPVNATLAYGQWIEIYNPTSKNIKLDGWVVKDSAGDTHTINSGGQLELAAGERLVLGSHANSDENGGVSEDYSWGNEIVMDTVSGSISLLAGQTVVDTVQYGTGAFPDTPEGASIQLDAAAIDATLNDDGANWCVSTATMAGGDLGTPGAANASCGS